MLLKNKMENKNKMKERKRLDTISFRGERKTWLRFLSNVRKKDKRNAWEVLGDLILNYLKGEGKK